MKQYQANFTGREVGAIGIFYDINHVIEANNEEEAKLKLYDYYEHINNLTLTEIKNYELTAEAKELYFFTKNHFIKNLKRITPFSAAPIIAVRQTVKKAMNKYILDYCSKGTKYEDVFTEEDFQNVSSKIHQEIMSNEL
jgi:hypothetical protein